jgi:leucyl-tRNA synthetase
MERYDPQQIEPKWQRVWEDERAWEVSNDVAQVKSGRPKSYVLEQLPYPSGTLHMGHLLVYTIGDVVAHFRRRNGMHTLHPFGFDSFGLPAENAAIKEGGHPREITEGNIEGIRAFMRRVGWTYDWSRLISTHEPEYMCWQQWQFLRFLERDLAYRKAAPVKWCPNDQTVLANEQVHGGRCERCGAEVEVRLMEQWFFRTTNYAQELLDDLANVEYEESLRSRQRNWIGRSEGAEILFRVEELDADLPVFTTRPDTLYGATFFVLAPEHELVERLAERSERPDELRGYVRRAATKKTEERATAEEKTGVFTGFHATNPVNGEPIPIYVADYVLTDYGTGAIMAVPAHDERDHAFAQAFGLPVRAVVRPADGEVEGDAAFVEHTGDEVLVNSGELDGLPAQEGGRRIVERLEAEGRARFTVNYRLRDWGFSRQRYWGCPIPIVYCDSCGVVPVPDDELPVLLPDVEDYRPMGKPPLAQAEDWVRVPCPRCGAEGRRETETMDTFVDSSWYFLRYCDPRNETAPFDREIVDYWNPVDLYIGGSDHATMHMIYARFWIKVLADLGLVGFREPFARFFTNGWVTLGNVKMSKRAGNVVGPDVFVDKYGADPCRLNILFLGPADEDMEWTEESVEGMVRFVRRLWRVVHDVAEAGAEPGGPGELARKAHETIAKVTDDIGRRFAFNTAIAAVMELVNAISADPSDPDASFAAQTAVSLIQPYAPHVAEELWQRLGRERLWQQPWPVADEAMLERDTFELVVQVNGKVRDRIEVAASLSEDELVERAKASPKVQAQLNGKSVRQAFVVPRKLVNLVVA